MARHGRALRREIKRANTLERYSTGQWRERPDLPASPSCAGGQCGIAPSCRRAAPFGRRCWSEQAGRAEQTIWRSGPSAGSGNWRCRAHLLEKRHRSARTIRSLEKWKNIYFRVVPFDHPKALERHNFTFFCVCVQQSSLKIGQIGSYLVIWQRATKGLLTFEKATVTACLWPKLGNKTTMAAHLWWPSCTSCSSRWHSPQRQVVTPWPPAPSTATPAHNGTENNERQTRTAVELITLYPLTGFSQVKHRALSYFFLRTKIKHKVEKDIEKDIFFFQLEFSTASLGNSKVVFFPN